MKNLSTAQKIILCVLVCLLIASSVMVVFCISGSAKTKEAEPCDERLSRIDSDYAKLCVNVSALSEDTNALSSVLTEIYTSIPENASAISAVTAFNQIVDEVNIVKRKIDAEKDTIHALHTGAESGYYDISPLCEPVQTFKTDVSLLSEQVNIVTKNAIASSEQIGDLRTFSDETVECITDVRYAIAQNEGDLSLCSEEIAFLKVPLLNLASISLDGCSEEIVADISALCERMSDAYDSLLLSDTDILDDGQADALVSLEGESEDNDESAGEENADLASIDGIASTNATLDLIEGYVVLYNADLDLLEEEIKASVDATSDAKWRIDDLSDIVNSFSDEVVGGRMSSLTLLSKINQIKDKMQLIDGSVLDITSVVSSCNVLVSSVYSLPDTLLSNATYEDLEKDMASIERDLGDYNAQMDVIYTHMLALCAFIENARATDLQLAAQVNSMGDRYSVTLTYEQIASESNE